MKNLHDLINGLKEDYKTSKLMGVIDKEKAQIVGKSPPPFEEMVEKGFSLIQDRIDRWGSATNQMWRLLGNFLADFPSASSEEAVDKPRMKKKIRGKEKIEEEEDVSDYEDEADTGAGDFAHDDESEEEEKPKKSSKVKVNKETVKESEEDEAEEVEKTKTVLKGRKKKAVKDVEEKVTEKKGKVRKRIIYEDSEVEEEQRKKKSKGVKEKTLGKLREKFQRQTEGKEG